MIPLSWLPGMLGSAVLLPLFSFWLIFIIGRRLGKEGQAAGTVAFVAIFGAFLLSVATAIGWFSHYPPAAAHHASAGDHEAHDASATHEVAAFAKPELPTDAEHRGSQEEGHDGGHGHAEAPVAVTGDWYVLGTFGTLRLTIGYYIDALTVCMFCMVTLIASCIHLYAMGYMHEELHDVTDHEVSLSDGSHFKRRGRYHRFFQFLSLFSFSMLGLVVSGNIAMTFVFWELVGICSYFLIGFYVERHSASTAANKAFIVNRVGDFGMIIGLMILWASLGTFAFGDIDGQPGVFSQVRRAENDFELATPDGMVRLAASEQVLQLAESMPDASPEQISAAVTAAIPGWRGSEQTPLRGGVGYWLLIIAGLGIFCGCVGKSAQFPLHVWLPDAMEGPTPVSALVHSATMVAAGVFLVARFYPVFTPEVLLVIASIGAITLFMAATIAITATDIKRVLAYSTVSQLGYMMMALGVGGWLAGVLHLFTHAFFKSLLFLCSGSVIHAVHTNEMPQMGGLRKKMPITAYTMLVGCLAIAGAGVPFVIGFSGYYSKDAILEQALSFGEVNGGLGMVFFIASAGGAAITAFYMFRLWYMTFAGEPRDHHRYDHAHESPFTMYAPLVLLSVFAVGAAWGMNHCFHALNDAIVGSLLAAMILIGLVVWAHLRGRDDDAQVNTSWAKLPLMLCGLVFVFGLIWLLGGNFTLPNMLEQARPLGTAPTEAAALLELTWPDESLSHADAIKVPATIVASCTALAGFLLATVFYGWRILDPDEVRRQFSAVYRFLLNKWWFDELYDIVWVRPTLWVSEIVARIDLRVIDRFLDGLALTTRKVAVLWEGFADQTVVDGSVNAFARGAYAVGSSLRRLQTGSLRNYILFIVVGMLAFFILASFLLSGAFAS
jgi:NADH-quinone oxidoreductase subunit L